MCDYHKTFLKGVEVNKHKLLLPPRVTLNKNNISLAQESLVASYKASDDVDNPFYALRNYHGRFYSIMHDGIQKFEKELNGTFIRTLDEANKITLMPWGLTAIRGRSLNADKLVQHLIQTIDKVNPPKISAYSEAPTKLQRLSMVDDLSVPNPPHFFKLGSLENLDPNKKIAEIVVTDWPINLMADSCATNICA